MPTVINVRMKQRRKTAASWTSTNEVLLEGEIGLETDTRKIKFGDGVTAWASLSYSTGLALGTGVDTFLATPSSDNLRAAVTGETGTGALVFGTSPNITAPTGIVKGDVGLGNADNTSDANKPVSTAQQTALNLKANLSGAHFTGNVGIGTAPDASNPLSILGPSGLTAIRLTATTDGLLGFLGSASGLMTGAAANSLGLRAENGLEVSGGGNQRHVRVTSGGYVAVGNVTPTAKVDIDSNTIRLRTARTPASATDTGNQGDVCWDASYIYVCTATNTWRRAAIAGGW